LIVKRPALRPELLEEIEMIASAQKQRGAIKKKGWEDMGPISHSSVRRRSRSW
jgi:hypothetical protein